MPEPTPDAWALIRHDYEHTDRPLAHICAEHDITVPMLRYRMKRWEWRRRKPFVPRQGPPPVEPGISADTFFHPPLEGEGRRAASQARCEPGWGDAGVQQLHPTPPAFAHATASDPPPQEPAPGRAQARPGWEGEEAAIVPRLQSAVARVLPAIEATSARLAAGPHHPREMEQAGRTLGALTRALRELTALLAQHRAEPGDDEPPPQQDIDEFRQELSRRLKGIIAARRAAIAQKT